MAGQIDPLAWSVEAFWRSGGNELLWSGLPLTRADVALDAGGFEGEWISQVLLRYGCQAVVVEPQPAAMAQLEKRFGGDDRVRLVEGAVHPTAGRRRLSLQGNASSLFRAGEHSQEAVEVTLVPIEDALSPAADHGIGCLKLNIEGGEFGVLEALP